MDGQRGGPRNAQTAEKEARLSAKEQDAIVTYSIYVENALGSSDKDRWMGGSGAERVVIAGKYLPLHSLEILNGLQL